MTDHAWSTTSHRHVVAGLGVAIVASVPWGRACAQQVNVEPSVRAQVTFTDNSRYGSGGTVASDAIFEVAPSVTIHRSGSRVSLDGTLSLDVIHYVRRTQSDQVVPTGALNLNATLIEPAAGIRSSLSAAQPHVNPFGAPSDGPTVDVVTASRFRFSPYVDYKFTPTVALSAHSENTWSRVTGADPGTVPLYGSLLRDDFVRFDIKPSPLGLTLEGLREDTRFRGEAESALTIEALRAVGWVGIAPQQAVGAIVGTEQTTFLPTKARDPIYGVRLAVAPDAHRYLNGSIERRFFGSGWNLAFGERTPLYAVNFNLKRGPFTFPAAIGLLPANGNVADALDAALLSRYPDPVARARAVQDLITNRGLPTNLATPFTIYSSNAQLNQTVDASLVFFGRRSTITFFALHARIESLLRRDSGQTNARSFSTDNSQESLGVNVNHRLTPVTNVDVVLDISKIVGLGALSNTHSRSAVLRTSVNTALSPRTTASFGMRRQTLKSTAATNDSESAAFVGLGHRF